MSVITKGLQVIEGTISHHTPPKKASSPEQKIYSQSVPKERTETPRRTFNGTQIRVDLNNEEISSNNAQRKRKREETTEDKGERANKKAKVEEESGHVETTLRKNANSSESRREASRAAEPMPTRYSSYQHPAQTQKTHHLPMKGVEYLNYIKEGVKTHEGRVYRGTCSQMRVGDILTMKDSRARKGIKCEITSCDRYDSFKAMLEAKGVLNMLPQLKDRASRLNAQELINEGVKVYEGFPGANGVRTLGAVAIGVKYLSDI